MRAGQEPADTRRRYDKQVRVIAGTFRSRLLAAPKGMGTRPTSDRLRETLFNILGGRLPGCRFVDLYAGTGAVGIEALSRGAAHVWFTENNPAAITALRGNLAALGISRTYTLEDRGTGALLGRLDNLGGPLDLIFLDPPYGAASEYEATMSFLGSVRARAALASKAFVIVEHSSKTPLAGRYGALVQTRTRKQGDAAITFYALESGSKDFASEGTARMGPGL